MLASLAPLARFAPTVLAKVADALVPGAGEAVRKAHQYYLDKREAAEKAEILKALEITEEKLNVFDRMFNILGKECGDLLDRVAALEAKGQDAADEITREVLRHPELQQRFDDLGLLVSILEHDVRRLDEKCASLSAFANELKAKQLTDTELADFRAFRQAKQLQAAGRFAESEPILLKLANTQPKSAAVAVAQAVARHDDPAAFDDALRRAVKLRPNDDELKKLATAATVAVTRARTPAGVSGATSRRVPQVGDTLDGWLLEARLGGGGWGIVYRATKKGLTKAVKVMRPDLSAQAEFVEAFTDEVFKLLRLKHANIVAVERNGFCTAFMCHYFVMPLLPGLNLEQHLARHGVPSAEVAMGWLTGLLDGLEHAHANGLIHRDVKPLNVMILPDGRAVLIDFGIAGVPDESVMGVSSFFAPPELHALGEADAKADLFMLAATVFYALRFDQPEERDRHSGEYETALVAEPFRKAFDAALASKRSKRPASAGEMKALLESPVVDLAKVWPDIEEEYAQFLRSRGAQNASGRWLRRHAERVDRWRQAADQGCSPAMVLFGRCCGDGVGVPKDAVAAFRWLRKAAESGEGGAMQALGLTYQFGRGVEQDYAEAMRWYRKAADAGDLVAMANIGELVETGHDVAQDFDEAMRWYRKAVDAGYAAAASNIGRLYIEGYGVPQDYAEAMRWIRKAADAGDTNAMSVVGWLYQEGLGVPANREEALKWYRKAAHEGDAEAMRRVGDLYNGHTYSGILLRDFDPAEALGWYRKAADAGSVAALLDIGRMYHWGMGVDKDVVEALGWLHRAVEAGDAHAMSYISDMYRTGDGVAKDLPTAIRWLERAVQAGASDAPELLAEARAELAKQ